MLANKSVENEFVYSKFDERMENSDVCALSEDQKVAYEAAIKGKNVLITGGAGAGKTFLLHSIITFLKKVGKVVYETATTGSAATGLPSTDACTLHHFVGCGLGEDPVDKCVERLEKYEQREGKECKVRKADVLVIDESSMLVPEFFDKIDAISKIIRKSPLPFGGMQLILCGDFAQSEPILKKKTKIAVEYRKMNYIFETNSFKNGEFTVLLLETPFRQASDLDFYYVLQAIRKGSVTEDIKEKLRSRIGVKLNVPEGFRETVLLPTNEAVQAENEKELRNLNGGVFRHVISFGVLNLESKSVKVREVVERKMMKLLENYRLPLILELKLGALVVCLSNMKSLGIVNGSQGVVVGFLNTTGMPVVRFNNGRTVVMNPQTVKFPIKKMFGDSHKDAPTPQLFLTQIPLIVAFALTIHRSQGMTLQYVRTNLNKKVFANGQAYVALSRVTTFEGLTLDAFHSSSIKCNRKVTEFYRQYSPAPMLDLSATSTSVVTETPSMDNAASAETTLPSRDDTAVAKKRRCPF